MYVMLSTRIRWNASSRETADERLSGEPPSCADPPTNLGLIGERRTKRERERERERERGGERDPALVQFVAAIFVFAMTLSAIPNVSSGGEPFPRSFREMFYAYVRTSALCIRRRKHRGVYSPRARTQSVRQPDISGGPEHICISGIVKQMQIRRYWRASVEERGV